MLTIEVIIAAIEVAELLILMISAKLRRSRCVPVDPRIGTDFMRGAQQFVDHIKTNIFVPMHFWDRPAEVVAFRPYAESRGCRYALISVPGEGTDI